MRTGNLAWLARILALALVFAAPTARAERLKDLASLQGVRNNQLIGYGLIVGLDGTGDQTTQAPFTGQSTINMLAQMGVQLPPGQSLQLKNVAGVMVTAMLPAFARPGQQIDVTVSSIGNAKSLRGGTLLMTPLKGADGQVYAMAQGNVMVVGVGASAGASRVQINHLSAGRVANGATVERSVPTSLGQGEFVLYELHNSDFGTVQKAVEAINRAAGASVAQAVDGRQIQVQAPSDLNERVAFLGRIENADITPMQTVAKVIVNPRTGSVVMNQTVTIQACAVAHGNLSVVVSNESSIAQGGGQTAVANQTDIQVRQDGSSMMNVKAGANLSEVVKALNALGANPLDLFAILQAMKAAGALRAELEII